MSGLFRLIGSRIPFLGRPKINEIKDLSRMMSTSTPPPPPPPPNRSGEGDQPRPRNNKKKGIIAAIGAVTAIGGMAYAYKVFTDEKYDPKQPLNWIQHQIGLKKTPPPPEEQETTGSETGAFKLASDTQASCSEKECDAPPPPPPPEPECGVEKKCQESDCLRKMEKEEELIAKANQDLERALKDVKPKAMEATEAALKAYCEAAELIKKFMEKAYCAIENEGLESPFFEESWCEVYDLAVKRCEKVKEAIQKGQCAWELLCRLREVIENGKLCKYTTCNPLLITAEETLLCAERELLNAKAKMDCVQSESKLVEQYRNLIEDFRRDLKGEMDAMMTGDEACKSNLTANECAMVLTHAYKKVLRVQKELAIVQANIFTDDLLGGGLDTVAVQTKLDEMKHYYETELHKALARQSRVHQDSMDLNKELLQKEFDRRIKQAADIVEAEQLVELRMKYQQATATLAAMEDALRDRKNEDEKSEKLRKLWAFTTGLYNQINYAQSGSSGVIRLDKDRLLTEFSGDEFVVQLLKTIPGQVDSSEHLRSRFFNKLDKECRKLAVFRPNEELSIGKYVIGYLQGSLISRCEGDQSSPASIFEILDATAFHLRRGELLDAVATLNKIEGLPRQVCQDWLADARAALEASQTLYALMNHANSLNQS